MDLDRLRARPCRKCGARQTEKGTCGDMWHIPNRQGPQAQRRWEEAGQREMFLEEVRRYMTEDLGDFLDSVVNFDADDDPQQQQEMDPSSITDVFQDSQI